MFKNSQRRVGARFYLKFGRWLHAYTRSLTSQLYVDRSPYLSHRMSYTSRCVCAKLTISFLIRVVIYFFLSPCRRVQFLLPFNLARPPTRLPCEHCFLLVWEDGTIRAVHATAGAAQAQKGGAGDPDGDGSSEDDDESGGAAGWEEVDLPDKDEDLDPEARVCLLWNRSHL